MQTQELSNIKRDTTRKLKKKNVDIKIIFETTGLSIEKYKTYRSDYSLFITSSYF